MARPLLPPRGVNVPTRMIYDPQLPPALILTWIQLRGLAWGGTVTPPLRMQELAALTGKCQATIYGHMSQLRRMSALSWRSTGQGTIIVTFADTPSGKLEVIELPPDIPDSQILESAILELTNPASLSPLDDSDPLQIPFDQDKREDKATQGDGDDKHDYRNDILMGEEGTKFQESGMNSSNLESIDPITTYRMVVHLTPNSAQRHILSSKVTNLPLWQQTLEHWVTHGWNPRNLAGMLQLYARGGPSGCRYCSGESPIRREQKTPHQQTLDAIESLRKKMTQTNRP
jgi:hypothetical protein